MQADAQQAVPELDPRERRFWIEGPHDGLRLFLRALSPASGGDVVLPVLYIHGATFPSALSIAHRFDGRSWRDALCDAGFKVWALDFQGFGYSDRYREMYQPPEANPPLCSADDASDQIDAAVRFILSESGASRLSFITHSWGSMPACRFAGHNPTLIDRIILFGPIVRRPPRRYERPPTMPAWRLVTLADQWARFVEDVPAGEPPVLSRAHFEEWGERYLDSDPESRSRNPASVKVPTGPFADILRAWHGEPGYDPGLVEAPVAIIRGAWDGLIPDEDACQLFEAFRRSAVKRDIKIGRATHLMHLEAMRTALYRETIGFLKAGDTSPVPPSAPASFAGIRHEGGTAMNLVTDRPEASAKGTKTEPERPDIPGYTLGQPDVAKSPISMEEWEELKKSALFSEEDVFYLRLSLKVLEDQVEDLIKTWRGIIFDHPHLRAYDENPETGEVDTDYTRAVAKRFSQWVIDTARAEYDEDWLDYQYEIGLRHHRTKKNMTDGGHTLGHIRARDLFAFSAAIVAPMKPFLARKGDSAEVVDRMYDAWWKSMILQATLWSQPYIRDGDF